MDKHFHSSIPPRRDENPTRWAASEKAKFSIAQAKLVSVRLLTDVRGLRLLRRQILLISVAKPFQLRRILIRRRMNRVVKNEILIG